MMLSLVLSLTVLLAAEGAAPPSTIEKGVLDHIVLEVSALPAKPPLVVRRFPAQEANTGTAERGDNEKRTEAVKMLKNEAPRLLAESILKSLGTGAFASVTESEEPAVEGALVLEGRFTEIDPGSRAKRYWGGFGAGKSGVGVEGTLKDATGRILATFSHRRHSGIGIGGGDYVKFLSDDTRDVGHDIAVFLARWSAGGDLRKSAK